MGALVSRNVGFEEVGSFKVVLQEFDGAEAEVHVYCEFSKRSFWECADF
jgi:hypothetical protein